LPNVQSAHRCPGNTHPDRKSNMVRRLAIPKQDEETPALGEPGPLGSWERKAPRQALWEPTTPADQLR
jgi:hypothetical protein